MGNFLKNHVLDFFKELTLLIEWHLCINGQSVHQRSGRPGFNPISSHIKDSKILFDATLLNTWHYKVQIKGKVEQLKERSRILPNTFV